MILTADEGVRGGKVIPLKATMDTAVRGCECVYRVFVARRTGADVNMEFGRNVWLEVVRERHWERDMWRGAMWAGIGGGRERKEEGTKWVEREGRQW